MTNRNKVGFALGAVSLGTGFVSLAALFQTSFDVCDKIAALGRYEDDLEDAAIKLQIEKNILETTKKKLDHVTVQGGGIKFLAPVITARIKSVLETIENVIVRNIQSSGSASEVVETAASQGKKQFVMRRSIRKIKWIAGDKDLLDEQFKQLSYYTNAVSLLVGSQAEHVGEAYLLRLTAVASLRNPQLLSIARACETVHPDIATAASVKHLLDQTSPINKDASSPRHYNVLLRDLEWSHDGGVSRAANSERAVATVEYDALSVATERVDNVPRISVLVEWRGPFLHHSVENPAQPRLNNLCRLLRTMQAPQVTASNSQTAAEQGNIDFGLLECLGWTSTSDDFERIGLVFRMPSKVSAPPRTLKEAITTDRRGGLFHVPDLGSRYRLAFDIASAVANLLAVGLVHRAIRSDNALLLDGTEAQQVRLAGFTYARELDNPSEFSNLPTAQDVHFYRPPDMDCSQSSAVRFVTDEPEPDSNAAQRDQTRNENARAIDMFGLGMVLLEIGLWQTSEQLAKTFDCPEAVQFLAQSLPECVDRLRPRCGNIYHDVVNQCLSPAEWQSAGWEVKLAGILTSLRSCNA